MKRPNIVITMADDQQASSLFDKNIHTPTLDAMRAEGTCFTQAHHFGSCHGAVCAPSRAMLHTGRTYFNFPTLLHKEIKTKEKQANVAALSDKEWQESLEAIYTLPMLGELLGSSAYNTFATGKWHNGKQSFNKSFQNGANIFFGGMSDHDKVPLHQYDSSAAYPDEAIEYAEGFSTDLFVDSATDFINGYSSEEPFFLLVSFTAPHDPRTPLPNYQEMYQAKTIELPVNYLPEHPFDNGEMLCRDELLAPFPRPIENVKQQLAEYYGMITHMDAGIGRVREALNAKGLLDNTLFIHTGDHGLAVGQHGLFGKQNMYEHSIKTPLIMTGPSIPKHKESNALVYQHDLFPTILEAANIDVPECDFESLWPQLKNDNAAERESIFSSYRSGQRTVKSKKLKLIRYFEENGKGSNERQLFNYQEDPLETIDMQANASYKQDIKELNKVMLEWMERSNDPLRKNRAVNEA